MMIRKNVRHGKPWYSINTKKILVLSFSLILLGLLYQHYYSENEIMINGVPFSKIPVDYFSTDKGYTVLEHIQVGKEMYVIVSEIKSKKMTSTSNEEIVELEDGSTFSFCQKKEGVGYIVCKNRLI